MATAEDRDFIARTTRTSQIIIGALAMGLVFFIAIATLVPFQGVGGPPGGPVAPPTPIFTYMAFALGIPGFLFSIIVPKVIATAERRKIARGTWGQPADSQVKASKDFSEGNDTAKLIAVFQTQLIIGAALNEGPAFFALIAYMLERNPLSLGLAVFLILGVAVRFPTQIRVEQWIDNQLQLILQERQFGTGE